MDFWTQCPEVENISDRGYDTAVGQGTEEHMEKKNILQRKNGKNAGRWRMLLRSLKMPTL